jgi:hypothetical protein
LKVKTKKKVAELEERLWDELGERINLRSTPQRQALFFDKLGYPEVDGRSTGAEVLAEWERQGITVATTLREFTLYSKLDSGFLEPMPEFVFDGRLYTNLNPCATATGRLASNSPNCQQVTGKEYEFDGEKCYYKKGFIAPKGRKLIVADFAQMELVMAAHLSQDREMVRALLAGEDLHKKTIAYVLSKPVDEVTKDERRVGKSQNFALVFLQSELGFHYYLRANKIILHEEEEIAKRIASEYYHKYFRLYKDIPVWHKKQINEAVTTGMVTNIFGRRRLLPDARSFDKQRQCKAFRRAINTPVQGCVYGSMRVFEKQAGYVSIEALAGQDVSIWDGRDYVGASVFPSGTKRLCRVTLANGKTLLLSPEHKLLVRNTRNKELFLSVEELAGKVGRNKNNYRVVLTEPIPSWQVPAETPTAYVVYPLKNGIVSSIEDIADEGERGEFLGRVASDGSISPASGQIKVMVAEHEAEDLMPWAKRVSSQVGTYTLHTRRDHRQPFHTLIISRRSLVRQLLELGIKEQIPGCVYASDRLLAGYLRGMFDGDGTVGRDGAVLVFGRGHTHRAWAEDIQSALLLLGIRSRVRSYSCRTVVQIQKSDMPLFAEKVGFINRKKQTLAEGICTDRGVAAYGRAVPVKTIEITDDYVPMYDVVNSSSGRFMCEGVVTHNSCADIVKRGMIELAHRWRGTSKWMLLQVHDEILAEVDEGQAEQALREIKDVFENVVELTVPMRIDAHIADNWYEGKG